jgi:putative glutathione S-transferase
MHADVQSETIVNNESSEVIRMFYTEFDHLLPEARREATKGDARLFPEHLKEKIEEMNTWVYPELNNGVYRTGFATSQDAYDSAVTTVFTALDRLEDHLSHGQPYLFGNNITEADIRLYPTILRFDVAYHTIFKCNLKMIRHDYPNLHKWLRRLYWDESERTRGAFKSTVDFKAVSKSVLEMWLCLYCEI